MLRGAILAASALLALSVAVVGYLVLQACAVALPFGLQWRGFCHSPAAPAAEAELATLMERNGRLRQDIALAERELGLAQCEIVRPPLVFPLPADLPRAESEEIDAEAWQSGDVSLLEGCWALNSNYQVTNVQTGIVSTFNEWTMCFDAQGSGNQTMTATNGTTCSGAVNGSFVASGRLAIAEPGNLACSDNTFIYQRDLACALSSDGLASCEVVQPELNRRSTVQLRRAAAEVL